MSLYNNISIKCPKGVDIERAPYSIGCMTCEHNIKDGWCNIMSKGGEYIGVKNHLGTSYCYDCIHIDRDEMRKKKHQKACIFGWEAWCKRLGIYRKLYSDRCDKKEVK